MEFEVKAIAEFKKELKALAKRHRSIVADLQEFIKNLAKNPFQGDEIAPGVRKIRMSITSKGRGKSGGARIITYTILAAQEGGEVYLVSIYDKADFSTIDVSLIKKLIADIEVNS